MSRSAKASRRDVIRIARLLRSLTQNRVIAVAADAEAHDAAHLSEEVERRSFVAGLARCLARLLRLPSRVAIVGPSMMPTLLDGDRCLVRRTRRVGRGDLVVFTDPEYPSRLIVKRVV